MDVISEVLGFNVNAEVVGRRAGDPPASTAATGRIEEVLGWRSVHDLPDMVASAWAAWQAQPPFDPASC